MNFGGNSSYFGGDQSNLGVKTMKYYAVGTTTAWNALSPIEQAKYEDHFENYALCAADPDFSGTITDNYTIEQISDITQSSQAIFNFNSGGFEITFDGNNYWIYDNVAGSDLIRVIDIDSTLWINYRCQNIVTKSIGYHSFLRCEGVGVINVKNVLFDGNSNNGSLSYLYDNASATYVNCVVINGYRGMSTTSSGDVVIENATFIDNTNRGVFRSNGNVTLRNVYLSNTVDIFGTVIDGGGIVTNDATAPEVANRNINLGFLFASNDPSNSNYLFARDDTLYKGVDPQISEHVNYLDGEPIVLGDVYVGARSNKVAIPVKYAVGTTTAWNALSPAEQAEYEDHFENYALCAADSDFTGTITDDYLVEQISDITQSSIALYAFDINGFNIEFNGMNYLVSDNYSSQLIRMQTENVTFINFNIKSIIDKTVGYRGSLQTEGFTTFINCVFDGNSKLGCALTYYDKHIMSNSIICNYTGANLGASNRNSAYLGDSTVYENVTFSNNLSDFRDTITSDHTIRNTYYNFIGSPTDGGGNVNNTVVLPISAFIDLVDFLPIMDGPLKVGVDPQISGHTTYLNGPTIPVGTNEIYSGANGYGLGAWRSRGSWYDFRLIRRIP